MKRPSYIRKDGKRIGKYQGKKSIVDPRLRMMEEANQRKSNFYIPTETTQIFSKPVENPVEKSARIEKAKVVKKKKQEEKKPTVIDKIVSKVNPKNWGVDDYTKYGTQNQAFAAAKKAGKKEFLYNGKRYAVKDSGKKLENWEVAERKSPEFFKNYLKNYLTSIDQPIGNFRTMYGDPDTRYKDLLNLHYRYGNPKVVIGNPSNHGFEGDYGRAFHTSDNNQMTIYGLHQNPNITKIDTADLMRDYVAEMLHARQLKDFGYEEMLNKSRKEFKKHNIYYDDKLKKQVNYEKLYDDPEAIEYVHTSQEGPLYNRMFERWYDVEQSDADYAKEMRSRVLDQFKNKTFKPYENQRDIRALQKALSEQGYDMSGSLKKDGTYDGIYGEDTRKALEDFQKKNKVSKYQIKGIIPKLGPGGPPFRGSIGMPGESTYVRPSAKEQRIIDQYNKEQKRLAEEEQIKNVMDNAPAIKNKKQAKEYIKMKNKEAYRGPDQLRETPKAQNKLAKAIDVAANPGLALDIYRTSGTLPDYFAEKPIEGVTGIMDIPYMFTNAGLITSAAKAAKDIPSELAEGDYVGAGLDATMIIPGARAVRGLAKTPAGRLAKRAAKKTVTSVLPKYKNVYRIEPTTWSKDVADELSGRWFGDLDQANFYVKNLKDPEAGVRILRQKMPLKKWQQLSGHNMPEKAKMFSAGTGNFNTFNDAAKAGELSTAAARRLTAGVQIPSDIAELSSNPRLINLSEGILPDASVNKIRAKSPKQKLFTTSSKVEFPAGDLGREGAMDYLFNAPSELEKPFLGIPRENLPFEKGGSVTYKKKDGTTVSLMKGKHIKKYAPGGPKDSRTKMIEEANKRKSPYYIPTETTQMFSRPIEDPIEKSAKIQKGEVLRKKALEQEKARVKKELEDYYANENLVGIKKSPDKEELDYQSEQVAKQNLIPTEKKLEDFGIQLGYGLAAEALPMFAGYMFRSPVTEIAERIPYAPKSSVTPARLPKQPTGKLEGLGTADDIRNINPNIKEIRDPETGKVLFQLEKEDYNFGNDWETMAPADLQKYGVQYIDPLKGGYTNVPQFNQELNRLKTTAVFGKRPLITKKDFYTTKELRNKIAKKLNYEKEYEKFAEQYPLSDADIVFDKKFPNLNAGSFQEKFMTPEQYAYVKSKLGIYGDLGVRDVTNPNVFKRTLASDWSNAQAFDDQDFVKEIARRILERTGKSTNINPDYLRSLIRSDEILSPNLLQRMGEMKKFKGIDALQHIQPNKKGGPIVSTQGFKEGPPPRGSYYRIPSNVLYNPTDYTIEAIADTGERKILKPHTGNTTFEGANYVDEYPSMKKGGWLNKYQTRGKVIYTDKALYDKAHRAEMDSLYVRKTNDQTFTPGYKTRPLTQQEKEYWKDKKTGLVPNLVEYNPIYPTSGYFGHFKKPVIHNVYQEPVKEEPKKEETKKQTPVSPLKQDNNWIEVPYGDYIRYERDPNIETALDNATPWLGTRYWIRQKKKKYGGWLDVPKAQYGKNVISDTIVYPSDNPYAPGLNKEIIDAIDNSMKQDNRRWLNDIYKSGMSVEDYYNEYPDEDTYKYKNINRLHPNAGIPMKRGGWLDQYNKGGFPEDPPTSNGNNDPWVQELARRGFGEKPKKWKDIHYSKGLDFTLNKKGDSIYLDNIANKTDSIVPMPNAPGIGVAYIKGKGFPVATDPKKKTSVSDWMKEHSTIYRDKHGTVMPYYFQKHGGGLANKKIKYDGGGMYEENPPKSSGRLPYGHILPWRNKVVESYEPIINENKQFITDMINSPLFAERFTKMTGQTDPELIKKAKQEMLDNANNLQFRVRPGVANRRHAKAFYNPDSDFIGIRRKTDPSVLLHEMYHGVMKNDDIFKYSPEGKDAQEKIDKRNKYFEDKWDYNPNPINFLGKEEDERKWADKGAEGKKYRNDWRFNQQGYGYQVPSDEVYAGEDWRSNPKAKLPPDQDIASYYDNAPELAVRVKVAQKALRDKGLYDPINQRFGKNEYQQLKNMIKDNMAPDEVNDIRHIVDLLNNYSEDEVIDMFNSFVKTPTTNLTKGYAKRGGSISKDKLPINKISYLSKSGNQVSHKRKKR